MATSISHALNDLGWDPGWATAFLPFDAAGWRPARVVAAHRDAWCCRDAGRRSRRRDRRPPAPRGGGRPPTCRPSATGSRWPASTHGDTAVIQAVLPRRTAFGRNTSPDGYAGNLAGEQVLAANVDVALVVTSLDGDFNLRRLERYLAVAWTGGATPVIVLNKADVADDPDGSPRRRRGRRARASRSGSSRALTGDGVADLADDHLPPGPDGRRARLVGRGQVHARQRAARPRAPAHERRPRGRLPRPPHDDPPRARPAAGRRAAHRHPRHPLARRRRRDRRPREHLRGHRRPRRRLQVPRTAATTASRAATSGAALADGRLDPARLASHRKLEREAAHVARASDPIARAAERRRWKTISASVAVHMRHKYGSDQ